MQGLEKIKEDEEDQDLWVYNETRKILIREHYMERATKFTPSLNRGWPVHPKFLSLKRRTMKEFGDGCMVI